MEANIAPNPTTVHGAERALPIGLNNLYAHATVRARPPKPRHSEKSGGTHRPESATHNVSTAQDYCILMKCVAKRDHCRPPPWKYFVTRLGCVTGNQEFDSGMKFPMLFAAAQLAASAAASPTWYEWYKRDWSPQPDGLEGFGWDNPLGPTTGGAGGKVFNVKTDAALVAALADPQSPKIIYLEGEFHPTARLRVGSNTSLLGKGKGANIVGQGITIIDATNVIVRNIGIRFVEGDDGITIQNTTRVWIDHNEFESQISLELGPDFYDGQLDIVRASDWITVSHNYFHDHWKSSLVGNSDVLREVDEGSLHITYHHNYWRNCGTRGPAARFGHQHIYNNLYEDFMYQAIHSRSDNQVLVEGNKFVGTIRSALTTYGLVVPEDSPNTCVCGDEELDGFANLGAENDFGKADVNITRVGTFEKAPYEYSLTPLQTVDSVVKKNAGIGNVRV
ncbi:hypothetical protein BST61_g8462 [Cercospora zeina]